MTGVHVRVRVGTEEYAVPVEHVLEVAELGDVTPVPGAPSAVMGVRNLRGRVLAVFDLAAVFGIESTGDRSRILVAEDGGRRAGLAVDEIIAVEPLAESAQEVASEHLTGTALVEGSLIGIVDLPAVLDHVDVQVTG